MLLHNCVMITIIAIVVDEPNTVLLELAATQSFV